MEIPVRIVNAFVHNGTGGNPAGVVLDADSLTAQQKLAIAARVGVSETAFVSKSSVADFKLEFFTPNRQIPHCGHATIATFSYLTQIGRLNRERSSKETIDGNREILLRGDLAFMEQKAPSYFEPSHLINDILTSLGIDYDDLIPGKPILVANTGNSFLIVPVRSRATMESLQPDMKLIHEISDALDLIGFYPFTTETFESDSVASTRMFGPRYAIIEEAGTGMAAGPLACYLHDHMQVNRTTLTIEQGWFMQPPSPSRIIVDLNVSNGRIVRLMAGGRGIVSSTKTIEI